ncbi:MAG: hypothetical protein COU29_02780 [Candidatus Magasanikbacteria bacterium CG10_big_fil_rev_8_21_14_0_10_36_32]|uniref:HTH cro/C1-type domain-containing protein n=1 Tax=Candidatus Magasanikbacteria bacterium CG10_big_fil_rev_8_21_14_0_10_36_32 TaxID=1974646 RepID=A0A2M6W7E1_9BACT|nr:MAG: hypothetical protein COU29_02780 [Candidatus Magasanikbacteria bacterium CG10_big_fil_rev_8_21_14_0_10_36_32]
MKNKSTENEIKKEIGENIKRIRRSLRTFLSAEVIAKKLGISRVAFTQIENGQNHVTAVTLWKLATIFGCDFKDFFPTIPQGFALSQKDTQAIGAKDKHALDWAVKLFGTIKK